MAVAVGWERTPPTQHFGDWATLVVQNSSPTRLRLVGDEL